MRDTKRILAVAGLIALCIALDQLTKMWAIAAIKGAPAINLLWDTVRIEYAENTGAWGSLGSTWDKNVRFWVLSVIPALVLGGIGWLAFFKRDISRMEIAIYALIVGGGAGNLWDRFAHGFVVDFLWMGIGGIGTNVFNVADSIIMLAFGLLVIHAVRSRKTPQAS